MREDLSKEIAEKLEKLRDLEVLSNDHSSVISGLISMEYTMATFISDYTCLMLKARTDFS